MSNFNCVICGKAIIENNNGEYITECEHFPLNWRDTPPARKENEYIYQPHWQEASGYVIREMKEIRLKNLLRKSENNA